MCSIENFVRVAGSTMVWKQQAMMVAHSNEDHDDDYYDWTTERGNTVDRRVCVVLKRERGRAHEALKKYCLAAM